MTVGVSTACFYPMETKEAFLMLAQNGIKNIEVFTNSPSELKIEYLNELQAIAKHYGVSIPSIHPFTSGMETMLFFSEYPSRFTDGLNWYRSYFKAAEYLNAKYFILHGESIHNNYPILSSYQHIKELVEYGREFGVEVLHENVVRSKSSDVAYLKGLREFFPEMKFVLDVKQAIRSGGDPFEFLSELGSSILHVHMSDNSKESDCLPINKGTFSVKNFLNMLLRNKYDGCIMIELYRDSFKDMDDIINSYQIIHEFIRDIS